MRAIYQLTSTDLNSQFLGAIKQMFLNKKIQIIISDTYENELDETDYLFSSETNKKFLLEGINKINNNENLVSLTFDQLDEKCGISAKGL